MKLLLDTHAFIWWFNEPDGRESGAEERCTGFAGRTGTRAWFKCLAHHHKNPFDRLLVTQANVEGASLVSGDLCFQVTL
jgi:PIN domain nuclease of toxin-antitoxin system